MTEKRKFGGAQPGSGRPATGRTGKTTTVYASKRTLELWTKLAEKRGQKKTQVLAEAIDRMAEQEDVSAEES